MRAPDPRHAAEVETLRDGQRRVGRCFATDDPYGPGAFMVWSEAQRAIGELMIKHDGEVTDTIGVADFWARVREVPCPWLHRMQRLMETMTPDDWYGEVERLADVQSALESLSDKLGHENSATWSSRFGREAVAPLRMERDTLGLGRRKTSLVQSGVPQIGMRRLSSVGHLAILQQPTQVGDRPAHMRDDTCQRCLHPFVVEVVTHGPPDVHPRPL